MGQRWLSAFATVALASTTAAAQTVAISQCGAMVPVGQTGVLAGDLTCPTGSGTRAVTVEKNGTLDLAGHTLAGGDTGVRCTSHCTVVSTAAGGTIRDTGIAGIAVVEAKGRLNLSDVTLESNPSLAVLTDFLHGKVFGARVTLTANGIGIQAKKVKLESLTASGNYRLAQVGKALLEASSVTGTIDTAVSGRSVKLKYSSVTGSGSGIDLLTDKRPLLIDSDCGVSRQLSNPTVTWGVCAGD